MKETVQIELFGYRRFGKGGFEMVESHIFEEQQREASFSADGKQRLWLKRRWAESLPLALVIGLNPSTADKTNDDPTIKSITRILQHNAYGGFYMFNLFVMITPYPSELKKDCDMLSNFHRMKEFESRCMDVVFAWGNFDTLGRDETAIRNFPLALCFGKNANGSPKHPLYLKKETKLVRYG